MHLIHRHTPHTPSYTVIHRHTPSHLVCGWPRLSAVTVSWMTSRHRQKGNCQDQARWWSKSRGAHLPSQTHQKYNHRRNSSYGKLGGNRQEDPLQPRLKETHPESGRREERLSGWDLWPWERMWKKWELLWVRSVLGSEQFEPQTGCPNPGTLCRGNQPPRRVGGPLGVRREVGGLDSARGDCACAALP